mmetsp:Transcript_118/g.294  ORF Transcript_118/g.294 Transcript_118/m.294 type:complete len:206 (-) Transcript_118:82-699(-)
MPGQNHVCSSIVPEWTASELALVRITLQLAPSGNWICTLSYTSSTRPSQCACGCTTSAPGRQAASGWRVRVGTRRSTRLSLPERTSQYMRIPTTMPVCPSWLLARATMSPMRKTRSASCRLAVSSVLSWSSARHRTLAEPGGSLPSSPESCSSSMMSSSTSLSSSLLLGARSTIPMSPFAFTMRSSVKIICPPRFTGDMMPARRI